MAQYQFNGNQPMVFPTLGVVVSPGDQFLGPDGIDLPDLKPGKGKPINPDFLPVEAAADPAPTDLSSNASEAVLAPVEAVSDPVSAITPTPAPEGASN